MIRTIVIGAAGRMGQLLVRQVLASPDLELAGATEIPGSPALGKDAGMLAGLAPCGVSVTEALEPLLDQADAVIDFSSPAGTMAAAPLVTGRGLTMVIGTTGLDAADRAELARIADAGARLVVAPNMSVGVNLLF